MFRNDFLQKYGDAGQFFLLFTFLDDTYLTYLYCNKNTYSVYIALRNINSSIRSKLCKIDVVPLVLFLVETKLVDGSTAADDSCKRVHTKQL